MPVRVTLISPEDRRFILAQWDDPVTGLTKTRSTKTTVRREAERFAGRLEDELNAGTFKEPARTTWAELVARYLDEVSSNKARKTKYKMEAMHNLMVEHVNPKLATSVTGSVISMFQGKLRESGLEEATIHGHMRELRKLLRWACKLDLIHKVPHIEFPKLVPKMKGRPVTGEELDRFLAAVPQVIRVPEFVAAWKHLVEGLWYSGLRLDEAMLLHWTSDKHLCPDFSHRRPMFRIQAASEKGRQFRLLPMTPEFFEFLSRTPERSRRGFVFSPLCRPRGQHVVGNGSQRPTTGHVGKQLTKIGEKAGIKVNATKDASAHDFRRSFGFRWAKLVMPKVLQELMRHESINTTMAYYVGQMAEESADAVWNAAARETGNTFGNTSGNHDISTEPEKSENP